MTTSSRPKAQCSPRQGGATHLRTIGMRVRDIGAVLAVTLACAGALVQPGSPASAQERGGAAGGGAGAVGAGQGPGRGVGPGRGRGPAADEPRGVRVKTDAATPGYLLFAPLNSDTTFLIDN